MPPATDLASSPLRRPRHNSSNNYTPEASANKRQKHAVISQPTMASSTHTRLGKMPESSSARPSAFQPYSGAKKLVIKNLKTAQSPAREAEIESYYTRALEDVGNVLDAVLVGKKPPVPFERLYRAVEDLCRKGDAKKVAKILKTKMKDHVNKVVLPRVERTGRGNDVETAKAVLGEWQTWNAQMTLVRSTFSYLDRTTLLRDNAPSINDMTISYFREMAFPSGPAYPYSIGKRTIQALCELVSLDRHGNGLDHVLFKGSIRMLNVLSVYTQHFEPTFLEQSQPFFDEFGKSHETSSTKEYIRACDKLLRKEQDRCLEYNIDSMTEKLLMEKAHKTLIVDYVNKLLNRDYLDKLLDNKDIEVMRTLYELLKTSNVQGKLRDPWCGYIRDTSASIIRTKEKAEETMVLRLLDLRRSLELMIRDAFAKDDDFLRGMRNSFSASMNDREVANVWGELSTSKVGEMLAKHIDMLMRGGLKTLPAHLLSDVKDRVAAEREGQASTADEDNELDRQLDQALELFRFIEGKDTFEAFYKKDLARRLLMGRSASQDAERNMLGKLRNECGVSFTHNLETMFKDQEVAKDEMDAFKEWLNADEDRRSAVDLQVMVLSSASWPTYPDVALNLPDEVATQMERYTLYYNSKHQGRRLTWKHCLGHCAIKAKFPKGTKELMVSAYQAVVLLLFNSAAGDEFLPYEQISKSTGLKGPDLDRTLQSLACGKARVLTKHPKGRDVNETDTFTFNKAFTHPNVRVKINQIQHKETKEENKATHERVAQDRRFETQAAIVRIMKSRKTMTHGELQAEVINMTKKRGSVEPAQIKKEIESLIDKDYLEREGTMYTYLA